jgi:threonine/homoserine efflux transporter RhtA
MALVTARVGRQTEIGAAWAIQSGQLWMTHCAGGVRAAMVDGRRIGAGIHWAALGKDIVR